MTDQQCQQLTAAIDAAREAQGTPQAREKADAYHALLRSFALPNILANAALGDHYPVPQFERVPDEHLL